MYTDTFHLFLERIEFSIKSHVEYYVDCSPTTEEKEVYMNAGKSLLQEIQTLRQLETEPEQTEENQPMKTNDYMSYLVTIVEDVISNLDQDAADVLDLRHVEAYNDVIAHLKQLLPKEQYKVYRYIHNKSSEAQNKFIVVHLINDRVEQVSTFYDDLETAKKDTNYRIQLCSSDSMRIIFIDAPDLFEIVL